MRQGWLGLVLAGAVLVGAGDAAAQDSRAYVANRGEPSVTVVDVRTGQVRRTIALAAPPHDVIVANGLVLVSMPSLDRVAVIDPVSLTVIGAIPVPGAPRDLAFRGASEGVFFSSSSRFYIGTSDGLRIYDMAAGTLAPAIAAGPGAAKAIGVDDTDAQELIFVAACDGGAEVRVITESTGAVSAPAATGGSPCAVQVDSQAIYVANRTDDTVSIFEHLLQGSLTVSVPDQPVAFAQGTSGLWLASANGTLTRFGHTPIGSIASSLTIGGTPTALAVRFDQGETFIVADASGVLRVLDGTGAVLRQAPVGTSPGAIALGPDNPSELLTLTQDNTAIVYAAGGSLSADARFAAFESGAPSLVAGDSNGVSDVFIRDRLLKRTVRVSVTAAGDQATGGDSTVPDLSADGRFVLFLSSATNLVPGDQNGRQDIFLHDRDVDGDGLFDEPGQIATRRVSVRSDGSESLCVAATCEPDDYVATLSRDGRHVAFTTMWAFDAADTNGGFDVYAHDTTTGRTIRVTPQPLPDLFRYRARLPRISGNGRIVAFVIPGDGVVPTDTPGRDDVFAADRDPDGNGVLDEQAPALTHLSQGPHAPSQGFSPWPVAVSDDGRWIAFVGNGLAFFDRSTGERRSAQPAGYPILGEGQFSSDARYLAYRAFTTLELFAEIDRDADNDGVFDEAGAVEQVYAGSVFDTNRVAIDGGGRSFFDRRYSIGLAVYDRLGPAAPLFDSDADGLGTGFELQFGLSATSASGDDGPDGDPDADGVTNAQEQLAGTHPRGFAARYLAEGATGSFFSTRIAVANPGDTAARVLLRYQTETGQTTSTPMVVPPRARRFVNAGSVGSLSSASFSTVIESDELVVVDRTMFWSAGYYGSHAEASLASPSTTWFLAEGATHGGFDLFYLLQNPSATTAADVEVRFLLASGPAVVRSYTVAAGRRLTISVDAVPGLAAADVSAAFTSTNGVPIIVERAMYYSNGATPFTAGHGSAGVTAPATRWFLAEGATGSFFDMFVLLANPSSSAAQVRLTYLRPNGAAPIVKTRTLPGNTRQTIYVESEDPLLVDTPVSTLVESTNDVGIVIERAMWWPAVGGWHEAHNSPGATTAATRWGFADGEVGGPPFNAQTYFLIANSVGIEATVRVTLLFDDGTTAVEKTYAVPANSRFNVPVASEFPAAAGKGFGALIESLGASPVPIVVERAMYSDAGGVTWAAGTDALGTPLPVP